MQPRQGDEHQPRFRATYFDLELVEMMIAFDGRPVTYAFGELDQIVLAYATTIHKSQARNIPLSSFPSRHSTI